MIFDLFGKNFKVPDDGNIRVGDAFESIEIRVAFSETVEIFENVILTDITKSTFMGEKMNIYSFKSVYENYNDTYELMGVLKGFTRI